MTRIVRKVTRTFLTAVFSSALLAQDPPAPAFDVASVKPNRSGSGNSSQNDRHGTLTATNVTLQYCIQLAYGVKDYQISGPRWLASERYDIVAKTDPTVTPDRYRGMIQTLLADRFKLRVHRETRDFPVYALVVGRRASKLREVAAGPEHDRSGRGYLSGKKMSMARLAEKLAQFVERPVLDQTGMQGVYDVELKWMPDNRPREGEAADGPSSIFTAVQEQLGLKLEPAKAPLPVIVVDHAEKVPAEN
jgi:uncharacterized protein (TIGR03435 family)